MEGSTTHCIGRPSLSSRIDTVCLFLGTLLPAAVFLGSAVFESLLILVGLLWLGRMSAERTLPQLTLACRSLVIPWFVWYGVIVASLVWNGPSGKGWLHDIGMIRFPLFALAMLDISGRKEVARPLLYGLGGCVLLLFLNLSLARYVGHDLLGNDWTRYTHKLKEGYRAAALLQYIVPFFFCWSLLDRTLSRRNRLVLLVLVSGGCWMLWEVGMRTALGATLGALYATMVYVFRHRPLVLTMLLALGGLGFVFILQFLLGNDPQLNQKLTSLYHRFDIWKVCIQVWHQYPVLGSGISGFQETYTEVATTSGVLADHRFLGRLVATEATHAHNLVLMLLAATGLAGFVAFCWLFSGCVRHIDDDHNGWRSGLLTWPVVLLISGLTGFNIFGSSYQAVLALFIILIGQHGRSQEVI
ncbi:O-antigen ligase family protein [Desulfolithobacter sp.]